MGNKPKGVKKPRPKPGMPQKLTKEVKDKIIDAIRCGVYMEVIGLAGERDWKAAAWRIEKRDKLYRDTSGTNKIGSEDDPFIVFLKGVRDGSVDSNAEQ